MKTNLRQIIAITLFLLFINLNISCKKDIYENANIILLSGDNQYGDAGYLLNMPIIVYVKNTSDDGSKYLEGVEIVCEITEGSIKNKPVITNSSGKAEIDWILGGTVGEQILTISAYNEDNTHIEGSPITISATSNSVPTSVVLVSGNNQNGQIGTELTEPILLHISDHNDDNYIGNIYLTIDGNGQIPDSIITNSEGITHIEWILDMIEGEQTATISILRRDRTTHLNGSPIVLSATGTPLISVTDIDGNTYNVVKIGEQYWMAENLKVTRYADSTEIPLVINDDDWGNLGYDDKGYSFYNNDENNVYGAYYTRAAALNGNSEVYSSSNPSNIQGVCPDGWHVPSKSEFSELSDFLGGNSVAGGKLKSTDTIYWLNPNNGATNESEFTAYGGGLRHYSDGIFSGIRNVGCWWSTTYSEETFGFPILLLLESYSDDITFYGNYHSSGNNVRCVKDLD